MGVGNCKDVALKKGLTESVQEEYVVPQVGEYVVGLEYCCVACVEKTADIRRGCQRNGEFIGRSLYKDYGWRYSTFCRRVATSLRNPVSPE